MQMPMTKPEPRDKAALVQQGTPTISFTHLPIYGIVG